MRSPQECRLPYLDCLKPEVQRRVTLRPSDIMVRIISAAIDVHLSPPGLTVRKYSEPVDTLAEICTAIAFQSQKEIHGLSLLRLKPAAPQY